MTLIITPKKWQRDDLADKAIKLRSMTLLKKACEMSMIRGYAGASITVRNGDQTFKYQPPDWVEPSSFTKVYTKEDFLSQAQSSEISPENSQSAPDNLLHGVDAVPDGHVNTHRDDTIASTEGGIQFSEAEFTRALIFCTPDPDPNAVPQGIFPASPAISLSNTPSSSESMYSNSVSSSDVPSSSESMYSASVRRGSRENSTERGRTAKGIRKSSSSRKRAPIKVKSESVIDDYLAKYAPTWRSRSQQRR